jgi:hypothetical protein
MAYVTTQGGSYTIHLVEERVGVYRVQGQGLRAELDDYKAAAHELVARVESLAPLLLDDPVTLPKSTVKECAQCNRPESVTGPLTFLPCWCCGTEKHLFCARCRGKDNKAPAACCDCKGARCEGCHREDRIAFGRQFTCVCCSRPRYYRMCEACSIRKWCVPCLSSSKQKPALDAMQEHLVDMAALVSLVETFAHRVV